MIRAAKLLSSAFLRSGPEFFACLWLPKTLSGEPERPVAGRAGQLGEFGAVSVVSGHIHGETNTLPLHVEILYNEYRFAAAFSVAGLLLGIALLTIIAKSIVEWRMQRSVRRDMDGGPAAQATLDRVGSER